MYTIKFKGGKEIEVTKQQKEPISTLWSAYFRKKQNSVFVVGGSEYQVAEIKAIEKARSSTQRMSNGSKQIEDSHREYMVERKRFLSLPLDQKVSQRKSFMGMFFMVMTGVDMPEEVVPDVKRILLDFFKENPTRMFPNPELFRDIMFKFETTQVKATDTRDQHDQAQQVNTILMGSGMLKRLLATDMELA
jgi:hypothetical protein